MSRLVPGPRRALLAAALSFLWLSLVLAQDHIGELRAQFNHETDPVRKAKALPKLGDAQFNQLRKETDAGHYAEALKIVEEYRDEVKVAETALKASGLDAERKPAGFKQLQIHVRKSVREIEQTVLALPDEQRPPFEAIRRELTAIEKELIEMLFPRQPRKNPSQEEKKG